MTKNQRNRPRITVVLGLVLLGAALVAVVAVTQPATVTAIVHLTSNKVIDAWLVPNSHPLVNSWLYNRAVEIIQNDPDIDAALGFKPSTDQIRLMDGENKATKCTGARLCAGATFFVDSGTVWVLVDLHDEKIEKIWWADKSHDVVSPQDNPIAEHVPQDCNTTLHLTRDGWNLDYRTTLADALEVTSVTFDVGGTPQPVATRLKLAEWHAHYPGDWGYRDFVGCCDPSAMSCGGGFPINPYGNTQIRTMYDHRNNPVGFEVVQDFRMSQWGLRSNYRYEQHFEFYMDGRWRVKAGTYGKGCGSTGQLDKPTYRPVMMMDVAVNGDNNDTFALWNGTQWVDQATEARWLQSGPYTPEGYRYRITDQSGVGYYVEPGQGQFDDYGTGDNAYMYLTQHRASESDGDLPLLPGGSCCNSNYQQGPHTYSNGEAASNQNITLWYVPASAPSLCYESQFDLDNDLDINIVDVLIDASHWGCALGDACYQP